MSVTLFELSARLSLDSKDFDDGVKEAVRSGKELETVLEGTGKSANMLSSVLGGTLIADGLRQLGAEMLNVAKESVQLASDLEEVQNVVDVTFGNNASSVNTWARSAKNAFGMSELNAKKFSGTIGAMVKSMGLADENVKKMSMDLVALAGDMASFYNLDHETAFEKIRSGISGETEPLKQLGINMSVANLEAFALSEGITKAYEAMTEAERATLRYNYLMSATADAQGDFSRTSNNYANAVRTFSENINEIKTGLGDSLLDFVTPALTSFNEWYENLTATNATQEQEEAKKEYETKTKGNQDTANRAEALVRTLEELEGQTELTEAETYLWNHTLEELVRTFPELKSIINLTTGEIDGGTKAVREYNQSWLEMAQLDAKSILMEQTQQAVTNATMALYAAQATQEGAAKSAEVAWDHVAEAARKALERLNEGIEDAEEQFTFTGLDQEVQDIIAALNAGGHYTLAKELETLTEKYNDLAGEANKAATATQEAQKTAEEAEANYKQIAEYLGYSVEDYEELSEAEKAAAEAQAEFSARVEDAAYSLEGLNEQLGKIEEYNGEAFARSIEQINSGLGALDKMPDWKLEGEELDDYQEQLKKALQAQTEFLTGYKNNLRTLEARGIDAELLAQLSDGSEGSAKIAHALATMTGTELDEYLKGWRSMQREKNKLAQEMTDNALAVDADYQVMIDAAKKASSAFDTDQMTKDLAAMENTVDTYTEEMSSEINRITQAAADLRIELAKYGGITFNGTGGEDTHPHSAGIGYVPYDGYLAELHRGEEVVTAAEAASKRQNREPASVVDYERIADVTAQRPVVMYVDSRAAAVLMSREMDTAIGNRNLRQLVSMGG